MFMSQVNWGKSMYLVWNGWSFSGDALLDVDIRATEVVTIGAQTYLFAVNGANGGLTSYRLSENGAPQVIDRAYFGGQGFFGDVIAPVDLGGSLRMVIGGGDAAPFLGHAIGGNGQINGLGALGGMRQGSAGLSDLEAVSFNGRQMLFVADAGLGQIVSYQQGADAGLVQSPGAPLINAKGGAELVTVGIGGATFLVAAHQASSDIVSYRIDPNTGHLDTLGSLGAANGLGLQAPSALETVEAFGTHFLLVAGAGSNSLSVLSIAANGQLSARDHVIDTGQTRFGDVQSLAVAKAGDRVFVVAGGGDDGLSLLTLLPDGRLIHLETLEHSIGRGLSDVTHIEAAVLGNRLQIFVGSDDAPGLARYFVDLGRLGLVIEDDREGGQRVEGSAGDDMILAGANGRDTLVGGDGNDILVAAGGDVVMRGGNGADRFVMAQTSARQRIEDFQAGQDVLDLSGLNFLRGPHQLTVQQTASGARVKYWDTVIDLRSDAALPLSVTDIFGLGFDHPDRVLMMEVPEGIELIGDFGDDILAGTEFADTLNGSGGADRLNGGAADDVLVGGSGDDSLFGEFDNDTLKDDLGSDRLSGGRGNDSMSSGRGRDTLKGGSGDDTMHSGGDHDRIDAGKGRDLVDAGTGNDTLLGRSGQDTLNARGGNDSVLAGGMDDVVAGGTGNDTVSAGRGQDTVLGESGNDRIKGDRGHDSLHGGDGADRVAGGGGEDTILGGTGRDTLEGGGNADDIRGGDGVDLIKGGQGNDILRGGGQNDRIWGGAGGDTIWGGKGADTYFIALDDGRDVIMDFENGRDRIRILDGSLSFQALDLRQVGEDVQFDLGTGRVTLEDVSLDWLDAGDFVFG